MVMDKRLLSLITPRTRRWMAAVVSLGWLIVLLNVGQIALIGGIIDRLLATVAQPRWLIPAFIGIILVRAGAEWLGRMAGHKAAAETKVALRDKLYAHLVRLGPGYLNDERTGSLVNTAAEGVENLEVYFAQYLPQLVLGLSIPLLLCIVIAVSTDWVTGLILMLSQPLIPVSLMVIQRRLKGVSDRYWASANQLSAQFLDSLQGLPTLKMFNRSQAWGEKLRIQTEDLRIDTMRLLAVNQISLFGIDLISSLGTTVITTIIVLLRMRGGMLSLGEAVMLVLLSVELARPLSLLGAFFHAGAGGVAAAQHIFEVLETPVKVTEKPGAVVPSEFLPSIRFEDVHLTYDGGQTAGAVKGRAALHGVSFDVHPGETVALVGASGAGKSSIFNLLLRFYDPQQGRVTLSGQPLQELPLDWVRAQMSLVAQDTYLFYGTIAENLRLARPDASHTELEEAAKIASIHEYIVSLPEGYHTLIGERGLSMSGGQVQRIAIAAAGSAQGHAHCIAGRGYLAYGYGE